jgi:hypothetical protein
VFYDTISLPSTFNDSYSGRHWDDHDLGHLTAQLPGKGCRSIQLAHDYALSDYVSPETTDQTPQGLLSWPGDSSNRSVTVTSKYRYAERWGNFLIVTAGAAAAAAIGFFPIAYESTSRRRRWRKEQGEPPRVS